MNSGKSSWRQEVPDFLQYLEEILSCPLRLHEEVLGFHLYFLDLSSWKLRFSDRTPVIYVRQEDLAALSPRDLAQSLADAFEVDVETAERELIEFAGVLRRALG